MKKTSLRQLLVGTLALGTLLSSTVFTVQAETKPAIKVGILQYVEHESLTANRQGFIDGLKEAGYEEGKNLTLDYLNAGADNANLQSMSEKLVHNNDYLFAIATPSAQALATATTDKPIFFSAVTDPVAAGLVESLEKPGRNVTGTIDAGPLAEQIDLLLSVNPSIKKIGLIYNSGESNSVSEAEKAIKIIKELGLEPVAKTISSTNDISQVMASLTKETDGIFLVTDNTIASAMKLVGDLAIEAKLPLIGGSADMVLTNGLATYGLDYYELGKQTAQMLVKHIEKEQKISETSVETAKELKLVINEKVAKALDLDLKQIKVSE